MPDEIKQGPGPEITGGGVPKVEAPVTPQVQAAEDLSKAADADAGQALRNINTILKDERSDLGLDDQLSPEDRYKQLQEKAALGLIPPLPAEGTAAAPWGYDRFGNRNPDPKKTPPTHDGHAVGMEPPLTEDQKRARREREELGLTNTNSTGTEAPQAPTADNSEAAAPLTEQDIQQLIASGTLSKDEGERQIEEIKKKKEPTDTEGDGHLDKLRGTDKVFTDESREAEAIRDALRRREISLAEAAKRSAEQTKEAPKTQSEADKKAARAEAQRKFDNNEALSPTEKALLKEKSTETDSKKDSAKELNDFKAANPDQSTWGDEEWQKYDELSGEIAQQKWDKLNPEEQMDQYKKQTEELYLKFNDPNSTPAERAAIAVDMQTIFDKVHGVNRSPAEREQARLFAENMLNPKAENQSKLTQKERELQRDIQEKLHNLMMLEKRLETQGKRLKELKEEKKAKSRELQSMRAGRLEGMTEEERQEQYNKYLELSAVHARLQVTRHETRLVTMQRRDTMQYVRRKLGVSHGLGAFVEFGTAHVANLNDEIAMSVEDKLGSFDEEAGILAYV